MKNLLVVILTLLAVGVHAADLAVNPIFCQGMVLQREAEVPVWGWANAGQRITVEFAGAKVTASTGNDGAWKVRLPKMPASSESRTLTISAADSSKRIAITDVLVGEVWLCGGQSNMEVTVSDALQPTQEQAAANFPLIRMATVGWSVQSTPQTKAQIHENRWRSATKDQVFKLSAVGYFFGRHLHEQLQVPIGLIAASKGGTPAEAWMPRDIQLADPRLAWLAEDRAYHETVRPGVLYNGMIHPLAPFAVRGAIWYQGENNVGRGYSYQHTLSTLIAHWRKQWQVTDPRDFPFGIVQLAGIGTSLPVIGNDGWAEVREAQSVVANQVGNGLVVALDVAIDDYDIHPKNKQEIGRRLSLWALNQVCREPSIEWRGPVYASHAIEGNQIRISFLPTGGGLAAKGGTPSFFMIAGENRQFTWGQALIDGDSILVSAPSVSKPVAVRYAWSNGPCLADKSQVMNVFGKNGLPLAPFRTDVWALESAPPIEFPSGILPSATVGKRFVATLSTATAKGAHITYALAPNAQFPPGLNLESGGTVTGIPTTAGTFVTTIRATADSQVSRDATIALTVHAKGAAPTWTVVYDANGANRGKTPVHQSFDGRTPLTLAGNAGKEPLARTGFTFTGWSTVADGSGETFTAGASYAKKADQVLFAKWTPIQVDYRDQTLPDAVLGTDYQASAATGTCGDAGLVYEKMSGRLPSGLNFNFPFGTFSGAPTESGTFRIVVKCKTHTGQFTEATVTVTVKGP